MFNSKVNYTDAIGKKHVMQGSCNVTGMGRILEPLRKNFGNSIKRFDVTLVRRWADIEQTENKLEILLARNILIIISASLVSGFFTFLNYFLGI